VEVRSVKGGATPAETFSRCARAVPHGHGLVTVTAAAPVRKPHGLIRLDRNPGILWLPGNGTAAASHQWQVAGKGYARILRGRGPDRFADIRDGARTAFDRLVHVIDEGLDDVPSVRWFGGGAFFTAADDPGWNGFFPAGFMLPRWLYLCRRDRAVIRLTAGAEELRDGGWRAGWADVEQWLNGDDVAFNDAGLDDAGAATVQHDGAGWSSLVDSALGAIAAGELEKVVVARASEVQSERSFCADRIAAALTVNHGGCVRFAVRFDGDVFTGVTPEQLVCVHGGGRVVEADALAGSMKRAVDGQDEASVTGLLDSYKNRLEFEYVLNDLVERMRALGLRVSDRVPLRVKSLKDVHHIHSRMIAAAEYPVHVLDLVAALHPTPAVCGTPREAAARWLAQHEPLERGWYAGPVGWFDEAGEGDFAVAIRSALLSGKRARVFAGCGIVRGSTSEAELEETRIKQQAMLTAMGVS
jgi:menaquinone-specific isochorismate synthase